MSRLMQDINGNVYQAFCPQIMQPILTTGVASVASAAFAQSTTHVELWSSVDAFFTLGAAPVATLTPGINMLRLRAGKERVVDVKPGQKVAIILASGTGTAEIMEFE